MQVLCKVVRNKLLQNPAAILCSFKPCVFHSRKMHKVHLFTSPTHRNPKSTTLGHNHLSLVIPTEYPNNRTKKETTEILNLCSKQSNQNVQQNILKTGPQSKRNIRHLYKKTQGNIIQPMKMVAAAQTCCHFTFALKLQIQTHAVIELS